MSGLEAFEAWWGEPFDEYDEDAIFALEVWQARDAEVAALEARIAELERALRDVKSAWEDHIIQPRCFSNADIDDIIEEVLR